MIRTLISIALISLLASPAMAASDRAAPDRDAPPAPEPPTRFAVDRPVDCLHIRLDLEVDVPGKHVDGTATLDLTPLRPITTVTFDAVGFELSPS